jgi:hypothetical protein
MFGLRIKAANKKEGQGSKVKVQQLKKKLIIINIVSPRSGTR